MFHTTPLIRFRTTAGISLVIGMALLAGCAQQKTAGYYDTPHDSTLADAQKQAQGHRGSRAPSQLQFGFGETETSRRAQQAQNQAQSHAQAQTATSTDTVSQGAAATVARPLLEAKTFLGTVPCVTGEAGCPASRITLTLAPSGEWRSRIVRVDAATAVQPIIQQGCWDVMGTEPLRIMMQTLNQESRTSMTFVNDNVLRITMYNDIRPILDYHLTRQADIDAIDELAGQPAINCD